MKAKLRICTVIMFVWALSGFADELTDERHAVSQEDLEKMELDVGSDSDIDRRGTKISVFPDYNVKANSKTWKTAALVFERVGVNQCAMICRQVKNRYCYSFNYFRTTSDCEISFIEPETTRDARIVARSGVDLYIKHKNLPVETQIYRISGPEILRAAYQRGYYYFPCATWRRGSTYTFPCGQPVNGSATYSHRGGQYGRITINAHMVSLPAGIGTYMHYFFGLEDRNAPNRPENTIRMELQEGWTFEDVSFSQPIPSSSKPLKGGKDISMMFEIRAGTAPHMVALNWVELRGPKGKNWIKAFCDDC